MPVKDAPGLPVVEITTAAPAFIGHTAEARDGGVLRDGDADGPAGAHLRSEAATAELHRLKEGWVQS